MTSLEKSDAAIARAHEVINESGISQIWQQYGCRVNIIGSVAMGLLASHNDIDMHVYSKGITTSRSFAIMASIAENPNICDITCINGLHTDERCISWHLNYRCNNGEIWKFDIIHIEEGSRYDGYFEEVARRIKAILTLNPELRKIIVDLKYATSDEMKIIGAEYYEAVISDGVRSVPELYQWIEQRRSRHSTAEYWMPESV